MALEFNDPLAHLIEAGSDFFLMPSRYEPCGLNQMYSLRYGTIPIVRATGGLADTVHDYAFETGKGNGFVFEEYTGEALLAAIRRALTLYQKKRPWKKLVSEVMKIDHSWGSTAKRYVQIYERAQAKRRGGRHPRSCSRTRPGSSDPGEGRSLPFRGAGIRSDSFYWADSIRSLCSARVAASPCSSGTRKESESVPENEAQTGTPRVDQGLTRPPEMLGIREDPFSDQADQGGAALDGDDGPRAPRGCLDHRLGLFSRCDDELDEMGSAREIGPGIVEEEGGAGVGEERARRPARSGRRLRRPSSRVRCPPVRCASAGSSTRTQCTGIPGPRPSRDSSPSVPPRSRPAGERRRRSSSPSRGSGKCAPRRAARTFGPG